LNNSIHSLPFIQALCQQVASQYNSQFLLVPTSSWKQQREEGGEGGGKRGGGAQQQSLKTKNLLSLPATNPSVALWRVKRAVKYYFYTKTNQMHQCIKFILFWNDTLHVSDGLSVHHQEFK